MTYITTKELSEKWGISQRRIVRLAGEGRIEGAKKQGISWFFPDDAQKPSDGRNSAVRAENNDNLFFRYPSFAYKDLKNFFPPLSDEELQIKKVEEAFYACRFEEADLYMGNLPDTTQNLYRRICTLYESCMIDFYLGKKKSFMERYSQLYGIFKKDFPYKTEMKEFLHELDAALGLSNHYYEAFKINPCYKYHESFIPHLATLSALRVSFPDKEIDVNDLIPYELSCILLEDTDEYFDLQAVHTYLGIGYSLIKHDDERDYHFKKVLTLAEKYDLYYIPCSYYAYMREQFNPALSAFSNELKEKIAAISEKMCELRTHFIKKMENDSIFSFLATDNYAYIYYAVHNYTVNDIAKALNKPRAVVSQEYKEIYEKLGVKNRNELNMLFKNSTNRTINDN